MKKTFLWMVLLFVVAATLQQCADHGQPATPQKVQFSWSVRDDGSGNGRTKYEYEPDGLFLSLATASGEMLFELRRFDVLKMGDRFISEPITLTPGRYQIKFFALVTRFDEVRASVPDLASKLGSAVSTPLPYEFGVVQGQLTNIEMEVIPTDTYLPEDFGYTSFLISNVNVLRVSPFIATERGAEFTTATAYVILGEDTIRTQELEARINIFSYQGNPQDLVKLVVTKPGYTPVIKEFTYQDFVYQLNGLPLEVTLVPAIFTIDPWGDYQMELGGESGTISVDWGDGTSDTYSLNPEGEVNSVTIAHDYASSFPIYRITVTGDLDRIETFGSAYGYGALREMNIQGLVNLKDLRIVYTDGPSVIDLTNNDKIESIMVPAVHQLKKIVFPKNKRTHITYMDITGPNQMTPDDIDALLYEFYHDRIVWNHVENGALLMARLPNNADEMLGPPSAAGIQILRDMRDSYHWHIVPDPQ